MNANVDAVFDSFVVVAVVAVFDVAVVVALFDDFVVVYVVFLVVEVVVLAFEAVLFPSFFQAADFPVDAVGVASVVDRRRLKVPDGAGAKPGVGAGAKAGVGAGAKAGVGAGAVTVVEGIAIARDRAKRARRRPIHCAQHASVPELILNRKQ